MKLIRSPSYSCSFLDPCDTHGLGVKNQTIIFDWLADDLGKHLFDSSDAIVSSAFEIQVTSRTIWVMRPKFEEQSAFQDKLVPIL